MKIDVVHNRLATKWTLKEKLGRILWGLVRPLFLFSPRIFWGWRRSLLRLFGARVGFEVHIYPNVQIAIPWNLEIRDFAGVGDGAYLYSLGKITIGSRATISQRAHLCAGTHDYRDSTMPLLKIPIEIEEGAWVCTEAFIGPGVTVGEFSVVGARAVVTKNVPPHAVVAGNPARVIKSRINRS